MIRLFIEDQELDVNQEFTNQITYAVDDLQNLDSKATAFSKTIVLPGTANNNRLLGNIFEFGSANFSVNGAPNVGYNFNASRAAKMRLEYNGVKVIKGTLRLLEIIIDNHIIEYEVCLLGELGGFIAKLGNKKLNEIDFSAYTHTYSLANITATWDNWAQGYGYYYPLIDYGNVSSITDKGDYDFRAFRPALFVREIIDKIITGNGYTWESKFFNTTFAKRLLIPNNQKRLLVNKTSALQTTLSGSAPSNVFSKDFLPIATKTGDTFTIVATSSGGNYTELQYNATGPNTFNVTAHINGKIRIGVLPPSQANPNPVGTVQIRFYIRKVIPNGAQTILAQSQLFQFSAASTQPSGSSTIEYYEFNYSCDLSCQITLSNNEILDMYKESGTGGSVSGSGSHRTTILSGSYLNADSPTPILTTAALGDTLAINDCMPLNIKQKDFFTSILKMFYLMVSEDKFKDKHLIIEPWVDFYKKDRTTYLDWSDKVDLSQPIRIKPMAELNARYYEIKYKSDVDWKNEAYRKLYNQGYGDRIFDNGYEFAKETDKTEVIFSATVLLGYTSDDKVVSGIYKWNNGVEEQMDSNIRILLGNKLTCNAWKIMDGTSALSSALTNYGYAGHLDVPLNPTVDINFGAVYELYYLLNPSNAAGLSNNLFNAFYSSYLAEITDKDSRVVTVKMKLNENEIYNLDFGRYILIDSVLYRLQKIIDYTPGELCTVELLRVISTNYN